MIESIMNNISNCPYNAASNLEECNNTELRYKNDIDSCLPTNYTVRPYTTPEISVIVSIAVLLCLMTVAGNFLVILSFKVDRRLQTVNNYFLLSLAASDLIIGLFSMPLFTTYSVLQKWILGNTVCDLWLALDYLCSNASVLNLLMISFDRFFSITNPLRYRARRNSRLAATMIGSAWLISFLTWPPWIFAWPYIEGVRSVPRDQCYIQFLETNLYVTVGTAIAAFYIPVTVMCVLYWRIWRETEKRNRYLSKLLAENDKSGKQNCDQENPTEERAEFTLEEPITMNCTTKPQKAQKSCSRRLKNCFIKMCNIDCDADGNEDDSTSPGATTPCSSETPVQSSRATSVSLRPEQLAQLEALLAKRSKAQQRANGESIYTIMIRLPAPSAPEDNEPQPSVTMITDDAAPPPPTIRTSLSTSALVVNSVADNNLHRYSSTDFINAARILTTKTNLAKQKQAKKKNQKLQEKKHDKKAARTLSFILMAFIITWTPYNVLVLIKSFHGCNDPIPPVLWEFSYYLCYMNSMINPLCYALANANFRKTYWRILTCTWSKQSKLSIIRGMHARVS